MLSTILRLFPESIQYPFVLNQVSRPQRLVARDKSFTQSAMPVSYGSTEMGEEKRVVWFLGSGPLVVCIHGWGGSGADDMGALAQAIVKQGFKVAVLDMTGHGASTGKSIGFGAFIQDISRLFDSLSEPVYAAIGFSAGGLSMMAARARGSLSAEKYICISSPCQPYPPVNVASKKLSLSPRMTDRLRDHVAGEFGMSWEEITSRCFKPGEGEELFLVYDQSDTFINHLDADAIADVWKGAIVVKTKGNKHRAMPEAEQVVTGICRFLVG